jgi:hypothetical protein
VIDITTPGSPQILGGVDTPGSAYGVAISGTHAYVADGGFGLQVIDVTDPADPQIVGSVNTPGNAYGVAISGTHAYIADYGSGLQVIDIGDAANPQIVGSVDTPGYAYGVVISGTQAYVADREAGLQVIDITNPGNPQITGSADTPDWANGLVMSSNHAIVADRTSGLQVIDITHPGSPQIVGGVDTPAEAWAAAVSGPHIYVADSYSGLRVFPLQCSGPTPVRLLSFTASLDVEGVLLEWETSSETNHAGFHVYRRTLGASWTRLTDRLVVGGARYSYLDRRPVAGSRHEYELESLGRDGERERFGPVEIDVPLVAGITLRAAPNPSVGTTAIYYDVPHAGPVSIRVFDLSGRLLKVLVDSRKSAGPHEIRWNAEDDSGRSVPAGIYFVKLDTEAGSKALRVAITR